ncbi:hypothetical protein EKN56_19800 [Limnobaculum zhutongyuii]|uniref:Uncharacterized protein n=1 Tax=Limnobaculum zhutongyuii TaxID=2498113 RepID=A0A411WQG5_9GAMM|nr:hypothetical protein [Limnobaculum zhutongyuii]QBH98437.1 hypothetical protein EKN56_19800 [Limnobaculum zhutongyuii]TQS89665.1 hypothetical protein ELQ32_04440 [Limnobaculum zhutongyuii]
MNNSQCVMAVHPMDGDSLAKIYTWDVSDNGVEYQILIRKGNYWHEDISFIESEIESVLEMGLLNKYPKGVNRYFKRLFEYQREYLIN